MLPPKERELGKIPHLSMCHWLVSSGWLWMYINIVMSIAARNLCPEGHHKLGAVTLISTEARVRLKQMVVGFVFCFFLNNFINVFS